MEDTAESMIVEAWLAISSYSKILDHDDVYDTRFVVQTLLFTMRLLGRLNLVVSARLSFH